MILALEFSSARRSVALIEGGVNIGPPRLRGLRCEDSAKPGQALPLIQALLAQVDLSQAIVDTIAIGIGPGSYTGIRAAIALGQGWQLARGIPLQGVSAAETLAYQAQAKGWFGRVRIIIDAQRDEFYVADYDITNDTRRVAEPLRLASLDQLRLLSEEPDCWMVGPELGSRTPANFNALFPDAHSLGMLAAACRSESIPGDKLEPIYLRETAFVKAPPSRMLLT